MFGPKIKIDRELYERLGKVAETSGYAGVDEFIHHVLEKAASEAQAQTDEELAKKQLQGLGYLE